MGARAAGREGRAQEEMRQKRVRRQREGKGKTDRGREGGSQRQALRTKPGRCKQGQRETESHRHGRDDRITERRPVTGEGRETRSHRAGGRRQAGGQVDGPAGRRNPEQPAERRGA